MISGPPVDSGCDYFAPVEFERCIPSCDKSQMDKDFLVRLNWLRYRCGVPLILNSAYRSPEWDKSHGRSGSGFHTKGRAVDIRCFDSATRALIVMYALKCGFSVGVHSNFVHLDDRFSQILFTY